MAYFPMFIELQNAPVLVIGGGKVALRKVQKLLPYGANITVVAPKMEEELEEISEVVKIHREFDSSDLQSCPTMVIAATDQEEVNEEISRICKEHNIPVNVADDVENCSFLFPSLVKKGNYRQESVPEEAVRLQRFIVRNDFRKFYRIHWTRFWIGWRKNVRN